MSSHPNEKPTVEDGPPFIARVPVVPWTLIGALHLDPEILRACKSDDCVFTTKCVGKNAFAFRVHGDYMKPAETGDTVIIVDPDVKAIRGSLVVASNRSGTRVVVGRLVFFEGRWFLDPVAVGYPDIEMDASTPIYGVVRQKVIDCDATPEDR